MEILVHRDDGTPADQRAVEVVERKGVGHPDSICDALAEELSLAITRFTSERLGRGVHHNVDKVLLVAGASEPAFGGGRVLEPMRILLAGRATLEAEGLRIPVEELAGDCARRWLGAHMHALDPAEHAAIETLVRPGSSDLVELFGRGGEAQALANDTSCGVGFAPLSELERIALDVEAALGSRQPEPADPAWGEDVKVMGVRRGDEIELTVACAFVGRELADAAAYRESHERLVARALEVARKRTSRRVRVRANTADDPEAGSFYLTVTGTSAEAGDDGQAGRGNRVNGLITPGRTMTLESVAGKNPVTHVGKVYNLVAGLTAARLVEEVAEITDAECRLVSRIGHPVTEPQVAEVRIHTREGVSAAAVEGAVEAIVRSELEDARRLPEALLAGEVALDRWPLRR